MKIVSESHQMTKALGEALGRHIQPGTVLALTGDLGAGKTVLAQGLALGLGITERVKSPTFVIMEYYEGGRLPFYHVDAYRVSDEELAEIGFEECFDGKSVVLVEWAENADWLMPLDALSIRFARCYDGEKEWREIEFLVQEGQYGWLGEALNDVHLGD